MNDQAKKDREVEKKGLLQSDAVIKQWQSQIDSKRRHLAKMIDHLHEESSDFLVNEFDLIIIPEFGKQEAYKKRDSGKGLSKDLKTVMAHLAHCRFRDKLICKCNSLTVTTIYSKSK